MLALRALSLQATWAFAALSSTQRDPLQQLREDAFRAVQSRKFVEAAEKFQNLRTLAIQQDRKELALYALNGFAGCHYGLFQYRTAIRLYLEAYAEAQSLRDRNLEGVIATNIASLYTSLGENQKALDFVLRYPLNGAAIQPESKLDWQILLVQVFSRNGRRDLFTQAVDLAFAEAAKPPPPRLAIADPARHRRWPEALAELRHAWLFDVLSDAHEDFQEHTAALAYAQQAYRLRATFRDPGRLRSLVQISMLERKLGHLDAAWRLTELVLHTPSLQPTPMQLFRLRRERALILLSQHQPAAALQEFRLSLSYPRRWRTEVLPTDSAFLHFEQYLNGHIQQEFLQAVAALPPHLLGPELAAESFWVGEEARYASMRAAFFPRDEISSRLGADYWPRLQRFQDLQARILAGDTQFRPERDRLEAQLAQLELSAGLKIPHTQETAHLAFSSWRRNLPPDETVFAYHLAEPYSLAWRVTARHVELRRIAGRRELASLAAAFETALRNHEKLDQNSAGSRLATQLFGDFSYPQRTTPFWTVVVEDSIARIPMSALPLPTESTRFLLEAHTLRFVPSALFLQAAPPQNWTRNAIGFADPVYNFADERLPARSGAAPLPHNTLQFNRLPATYQETRSALDTLAQRSWRVDLASGQAATAASLRRKIQDSPDILHIAAHFGTDPQRPELLSIALSSPSHPGQGALFTALDLTTLRSNSKLISLDGCASGLGKSYPGLGMIGLSRAFLVSGAHNVLGTLWPMEDLSGPLFPDFYRRLSSAPYSSRAVSLALQQTQLALLKRSDPYSAPSYWAAYQLLQRN